VTAVTPGEWLTAALFAVGGFVPGAIAILALDHPRLQRAVLLPLAAAALYLAPATPKETRQ
jgi:hypothetical protein